MTLAESNPYSTLWNKYRPVILQLMSAATENGPQEYKLFVHEFKAVGLKEKSGYSFVLEASHGKAVNNIRTSTVAKDLLHVLQNSRRATELLNEAPYELALNKNFILKVTRKEVAPESVKESEQESVKESELVDSH